LTFLVHQKQISVKKKTLKSNAIKKLVTAAATQIGQAHYAKSLVLDDSLAVGPTVEGSCGIPLNKYTAAAT
jgi:hypothetical protein